ncbi:MAG: PAS domain S-box protein [Ignavibacteria bacterium]|nr:PAS domain S-box protein [Ignavibacteria bacterium]
MKTFGYRYLFGITGAVLIFISIGIVSYANLDKDENAGIEAARSYEILHVLKEIESGRKDVSILRRGYLIYGGGISGESFELLKTNLISKTDTLRVLTSIDKQQSVNAALLKKLVLHIISLSERSIFAYRLSGRYDSLQRIATLAIVVMNYQMEYLFNKIENEQRAFLVQEVENEASAGNMTRKFIVAGNVIALMMILASIIMARKQQLQKQMETYQRLDKEKELRNKQIELETLMNILPAGVFYVDNNERCSYVNDTWCKLTGFTPQEVYGTNLMNVVHVDDRDRVFKSFFKAIVSGGDFREEYRYVCKSGEVKHVIGQAAIRRDIDEKLLGFIGSVVDISALHIFREELVKYNTLFESIAESISDPIFVKDLAGRYEFINSAVAEVIGKEIEEIIGKNDYDLFSLVVAKETIERDMQLYKSKGSINYEVTAVMPNGKIKTFLSTKGLIHDSKNKPVGLFGFLRDITAMKENENRINKSLVEKETLLRETHHRVKNNLQIVASLLKLQSGYITDTDSKRYFEESQNRIKTIAILHEKLYGSEIYTSVQLKRYVEELIGILKESFGINSKLIKINTEIEDIDLDIEYSVPVGLVINEIVTNSLKYAFPNNVKGQINIIISSSAENLLIKIGDNGIGLSEKLDIDKLESLGLKLIFTLVEGQLSGEVKFLPGLSGLTYALTIPVKKHEVQHV